jgi:hypothetical protein
MDMKSTASGWVVRETDLVFPEVISFKKMFIEGIILTKPHSEEDTVIRTENGNEHYKAVCLLTYGEYTYE